LRQHAVDQGELRLFLQPKVRAGGFTVKVAAKGALVRWQHPEERGPGAAAGLHSVRQREQTGFVRLLLVDVR
jgi:EAL domain-containing protein (putative c-di-GMP-specific phosphodiesterase class I)